MGEWLAAFFAETAAAEALSATAAAELGSVGIMEGSLLGAPELAAAGGEFAVFPGFGEAALVSGAPGSVIPQTAGLGIGVGDVLAGVGAGAALLGGARGAQAAEFEAAQFREEMEIARVAAEQEEVQRRRQLRATLAAQTAIRAGRGVELFGSGSFEAIRKRTIEEAEEDITTAKLNAFNRSRRFSLAAAEAESRGQSAILGGVGTAATAFAKGTRS